MIREDEKKKVPTDENNIQQTADPNAAGLRKEDDEQHSYPGKLDSVEGSMNNGEIGGGISKEE
jgi:hypothetical protein